jgi:uncharacterized damage-inducible protein DinB
VSAEPEFIAFSAEKLEQLCGRIEDCLGRLSEDQVWMRNTANENAVGNLVLHLCGNVTQWIGTGVAGRPDQRQRDGEFAARGDVQPAELAARIRAVVEDAAAVIRSLTPERLAERTRVQKYDVTVLEAVYHVVEHFSMHAGQILFATKLLTGRDLGYYRHLSAPAHKETLP